jgi:hypothetical protein
MKNKSIAVALITVLLFMVLGNSIACTTQVAEYALTISSTEGGSITTPREGRYFYDEGEVVKLVAKAEEGCRFDGWTGKVGTIANVRAATTTITMNGDYSITANFEQIAEYDLTISSTDGGSVTMPVEGTHTYNEGEVVNLVAEAEGGYHFVNWTGDVDTIADISAATTTITMQGDYSIMANFAISPIQYNLTISSTFSGSVTVPGEGTFTYDEGTVVSLVAEPKEGCLFHYWTGDVDTIAGVNAATTTITMNGDYAITAKFLNPDCGNP